MSGTGCFSSIRSHLFCTCKLPTHPPDHDEEVRRVDSVTVHPLEPETEKTVKVSVSPGIVARLMGLDSMPDPNWVPKERSVDSVRRSRSVNSIDYWSEFDPVQGLHRRVRTSWSFHDIPTFLQIDDSEFVLVRSQTVRENRGSRSKERKPEMRTREVKNREAEITKNKANRREKQVCSKVVRNEDCRRDLVTVRPARNASTSTKNCRKPASPSRGKTPSEVANHRRRAHNRDNTAKEKGRRSLMRVEPQCNLENLRVKPKTNLPVKEISRRRRLSSRRKQPLEYMNKEARRSSSSSSDQCRKSTKSGCYLKVRLPEEEMESLAWKPREMWKMIHVEEIGIEFGLRILDRLVHEVVAELSGLSAENLGLLIMEDSVTYA